MSEFHETRMGQRFLCRTMPDLVEQIARLNDNLERLVAVVAGDAKVREPASPHSDDGETEEQR